MSYCHCGRVVVGLMSKSNKPIHEENGKLFYCEPKFKYGDYVRIIDGVGSDSNALFKVISLDTIGYYSIKNRNGRHHSKLPEDLELMQVPKFYEQGNRLTIGCVFDNCDGKYIVTNAYMTTGTHSEDYVLKVHAKKLKPNDDYDHNGKDIEFYQRNHIEVIDIKELSFV